MVIVEVIRLDRQQHGDLGREVQKICAVLASFDQAAIPVAKSAARRAVDAHRAHDHARIESGAHEQVRGHRCGGRLAMRPSDGQPAPPRHQRAEHLRIA